MRVLVLEPDYWRYLGILQILKSDSSVTLLGEIDHKKLLAMRSAPPELRPDIVIVSHSLTIDYQVSILQHLRDLFPEAQLLVEGYDETLDAIANVLRAGAKGYFQLTSEPRDLLKALEIVQQGRIWAPREAVVLMVSHFSEESAESANASASGLINSYEVSVVKLLLRGLSNKEIARALGVAEVTIKTHLTKLYRKFGVHTRLELLAYAINHHLIGGSPARAPRPETHAQPD